MLQAKLIVVRGEAKTQELKLKLPTVIGRGKEANLKVPLALVSRRHCEIRERDGRLFIRDLGSLNGTFVNNYKITNEQPLLPGEQITIGSVTFQADYQLSSNSSGQSERGSPIAGQCASLEYPAESPTEQIVFNSITSERPTTRNPGEKQAQAAAALALDATIPGNIAAAISSSSPGDPQDKSGETSHPTSSRAPATTTSSPIPVTAFPERFKNSQPSDKRETSADARVSNRVDQANVLDDFPIETTPQKSISLTALEELRQNAPRQVSFIGNLNFEGSVAIPSSEPIQLDLGNETATKGVNEETVDSRLDSFLRGMANSSD